jgi:hypothetical protein
MQISIVTDPASRDVIFSGVLDKRWLRMPPEFLRSLYGGTIEWKWTMVGQLTYLSGATAVTQEDIDKFTKPVLDEPAPEGDQAPQPISMRQPLRTVFERLRFFERVALESGKDIEIIISPIAIYRETSIPSATTT